MNRQSIAIACTLAALTSSSAFAQQFYVAAGAGLSHADVDCTGTDSCKKNDTAFKILGGYEFLPAVAAEASYSGLGKVKTSGDGINIDFKGSYWGLGAAYRPQFGNGWGGVARLGAAFTTGKIEGEGETFTKNSTHPYFGVGVSYALNRQVKAELDWDSTRIKYAVDDVSTTGTVTALTLGLNYGF